MPANIVPLPYHVKHHRQPEDLPPTVGALTRLAWLAFRERVYDAIVEAGYSDLPRTHALVFRYPTIEGMRPTELAEEMVLSKQAMNDLLRQLEAKGYLELRTDPADGRARLIALTKRGSALMKLTRVVAQDISAEWGQAVGYRRLNALRRTLVDLIGQAKRPERAH